MSTTNYGPYWSKQLDAPICPICEGRGTLDGVDYNYGDTFDCEACDSGVLLHCGRCGDNFTQDSTVHEWLNGRFCCDRCDRDIRHDTEPPPSAPRTLPCLVTCDQAAAETLPETAANDHTPLLLAESLELIEDARAAGVEPREAFRLVRQGIRRREAAR